MKLQRGQVMRKMMANSLAESVRMVEKAGGTRSTAEGGVDE